MLDRIREYLGEKLLQVGQLCKFAAQYVRLILEADQILNSVEPRLNLLHVHQRCHTPPLELPLAKESLAMVHILEQAAVLLTCDRFDDLQVL